MPELNISSGFGHKTVAKGVRVDYALNDYTTAAFEGGNQAQYAWNWFITYHYLDDDGVPSAHWSKKQDDAGNSIANSTVFVRKWDKVGRHLVQCAGRNRATNQLVDGAYARFPQQVEELSAILESQMADAKRQKLPHPEVELTAMWKWLYIVSELGKQQAATMSAEQKRDHHQRIAELERQAEKLKALLARCSDTIWPFHAVYLAKESMEDMPLRVFLTQPKGQTDRVMIVDWTNLDEPKLHGLYEGKFPAWKGRRGAKLIEAGFKNAIEAWQENNQYWPGGIRYDFKRTVAAGEDSAVNGMITTGDTSWKEDLAGVLQKIAMGAAVIGLVLTGVGSVYAGAMIVTSMVASTTASVLSIHHRHSKGQGAFIDDAIDVLDIVANVFGVGYRAGRAVQRMAGSAASETVAWKMGRTLRLKLSDKVIEAMFVGEVWADGFAGLLLGVQFAKRFSDLINAKGMSPEQRANALLGLFAEAAAQGALHGVNNKVATGIEQAQWGKLLERTDVPDNLVTPSRPGAQGGGGGAGARTSNLSNPSGAGSPGRAVNTANHSGQGASGGQGGAGAPAGSPPSGVGGGAGGSHPPLSGGQGGGGGGGLHPPGGSPPGRRDTDFDDGPTQVDGNTLGAQAERELNNQNSSGRPAAPPAPVHPHVIRRPATPQSNNPPTSPGTTNASPPTAPAAPPSGNGSPPFRGNTRDNEKKVTVVNKQQRHPPAGVPAQGQPRVKPFPPNDPNIWKNYKITDSRITLETHDGFHFTADVDHNGYVTIDIQTRVNDKHNPHLGTGRENFERMFHHFESNGHEIKGWHGLFVQDNYKQIQKVKAKNPKMKDADLVLESVTGRHFWAPWAGSRNLRIVVEDARDIRGGMFPFSVRFEKSATKQAKPPSKDW